MAWNADGTRHAVPHALANTCARCSSTTRSRAASCELDGVPINLHDIRVPIFNVGTVQDHVAPWRSVFKLQRADRRRADLRADRRRPQRRHRQPAGPARRRATGMRHWHAGDRLLTPDEWLAATTSADGSWWTAWADWLRTTRRAASRRRRSARRRPGCRRWNRRRGVTCTRRDARPAGLATMPTALPSRYRAMALARAGQPALAALELPMRAARPGRVPAARARLRRLPHRPAHRRRRAAAPVLPRRARPRDRRRGRRASDPACALHARRRPRRRALAGHTCGHCALLRRGQREPVRRRRGSPATARRRLCRAMPSREAAFCLAAATSNYGDEHGRPAAVRRPDRLARAAHAAGEAHGARASTVSARRRT